MRETPGEGLGLVAHEGHMQVTLRVAEGNLLVEDRAHVGTDRLVGVLAHGVALPDGFLDGEHGLFLLT